MRLGDVELLHDLLEPYAHLHAVGSADGPSSGPVDLHLGRLAALLGRSEDARTHLTRALRSAEAIHALPHAAPANLELARLLGGPATERAAHECAAATAAAALGMAPLAAEVTVLAAARSRGTCGPLSPRETEIRRAGGRRAEQPGHRGPPDPVRAHGREPCQPHHAQDRAQHEGRRGGMVHPHRRRAPRPDSAKRIIRSGGRGGRSSTGARSE